MSETSLVEEPRLTVVRRRTGPGPSRRFVPLMAALLAVLLPSVISLAASGNLLLPFRTVTVLEGRMGSKTEFFEDEEVTRILLRHGIRVHATSAGSREVALDDLTPYDFVFPSGQPAADVITAQRGGNGGGGKQYAHVFRPFVSPIVLATYRPYAQTLVDAGAATPQRTGADASQPLYYDLDLAAFLRLVADRRSWNDLGIRSHGPANGNAVAAHTSHVCQSNSAATFLAQVAFTMNGAEPDSGPVADELAARIKPLLAAQGMPGADVFQPYVTEEGRGIAPVVVVYEHQYLAYQMRFKARSGHLDGERVLLYPSNQFVTQPQFIALDPRADRLGELITQDPALRARAAELGFRPLGEPVHGRGFAGFLEQQGVPAPGTAGDDTRTNMPSLALMERMISAVGDCPPAGPAAPPTP